MFLRKRYCNKICHNPPLVEDTIQDVFVDIWRLRATLTPCRSIKAYLYASLRRRILKEDQKKSLLDFDWNEMRLATLSDESILIEKEVHDEQLKKLKANLGNLSPRQYEAIMLRFYDQLSYAEIGSLMNANEQSVRNIIQRGIEHLRQSSKRVVS
ncbi:MAG: sigma-70 family RNA polymerase sigma factor [Cyclobacteriaceae bacterium]|nr:sigma-70 family RNA polymerase sigma factor [Cyclobacteriaceae bacterium]